MPDRNCVYFVCDIKGLKRDGSESHRKCNSPGATGVAGVASVEPLQTAVDRGTVDAELSRKRRNVVAAVLECLA